jgi:7,8-dihydroneopterin aldolase/epimerase/oxygenase
MHDLILLHGVALHALIGVYDWERTAPRPLIVDLALGVDLAPAGDSDAVADTVDYAAVTELLEKVCAAEQPQLLEALAARMVRALFETFQTVQAVTLTVHKPGILSQVKDVAICIHRQRGA